MPAIMLLNNGVYMNKFKLRQYISLSLITVILIFLDQITKLLAKNHLMGHKPIIIIPNILKLDYLDGGNRGAAFGMLHNKLMFFILITILAIAVIIAIIKNSIYVLDYGINNNYDLIIKAKKTMLLLNYMMSVLLAGAIGNFIDRCTRGSVIDFISFDFINFPIFNVADIYVTVSCAFIMIICIFRLDGQLFNYIFSFKKPNLDELKEKEKEKYVRRFRS